MMLLPEEAESALLAAQVGALHLALRNPEDLDVREERGRATVSSLLAGEREHGLEQLRLRVLRGPLGPRAPQGREGAPRPGPTTAVAPIPTFQSRK
jgi:pilus assembly protein CpaB